MKAKRKNSRNPRSTKPLTQSKYSASVPAHLRHDSFPPLKERVSDYSAFSTGVIDTFFGPFEEFHTEEEKLRKFKAFSAFGIAASRLLCFIETAKIPEREKEELVRLFHGMCRALQEGPRIAHATKERLRPQKGRETRSANSKQRKDIVLKSISELPTKKRLKSASSIAEEIAPGINAALAAKKLKPLKTDTIRKLIAKSK